MKSYILRIVSALSTDIITANPIIRIVTFLDLTALLLVIIADSIYDSNSNFHLFITLVNYLSMQ